MDFLLQSLLVLGVGFGVGLGLSGGLQPACGEPDGLTEHCMYVKRQAKNRKEKGSVGALVLRVFRSDQSLSRRSATI